MENEIVYQNTIPLVPMVTSTDSKSQVVILTLQTDTPHYTHPHRHNILLHKQTHHITLTPTNRHNMLPHKQTHHITLTPQTDTQYYTHPTNRHTILHSPPQTDTTCYTHPHKQTQHITLKSYRKGRSVDILTHP